MELIADIGGTGSRWVLLSDEGTKEFTLPGYHPLAKDDARFKEKASAAFKGLQVTKLHAYATGTDTAPDRIKRVLNEVLPNAELHLQNDLMAVARGLCGNESGSVMILGTGMNFAWYDGSLLHHRMPCLGAFLGDEGSGADLGKRLLHDAYYGLIPADEMNVIFPEGLPELSVTLHEIHHGKAPNQHMASFVKAMGGHEELRFVRALLNDRFEALAQVVERYFNAEERSKVFASGSIALGFQQTLRHVFGAHGMHLVKVEKDPMPGLIEYHQQLLSA